MNHQDQLYTIISELFDLPKDNINANTSRDDVEKWDSMGTIDLVAQLEKNFGISFDLLEVEELHTVGIIQASLEEKGISFA